MTIKADWTDHILSLNNVVSAIRHTAVPDHELVDAVGNFEACMGRLSEYVKGLKSEIPIGAVGILYTVKEQSSATRTYNTDGILSAIMEANVSDSPMLDAMQLARGYDAARLEWRWTELQRLARDFDITFKVAKHAISDGDDEHIGETWKTTTKIVPTKKETE